MINRKVRNELAYEKVIMEATGNRIVPTYTGSRDYGGGGGNSAEFVYYRKFY